MHTVLHLISLLSWCLESYVMLILVGYIMAIGSAAKYVSIILLQKVVTRVTYGDEIQHRHIYNYPSNKCLACESLGAYVSDVLVWRCVCLVRGQRVQMLQQCYLRCTNTDSEIVRCCMYST